MLTILCRGERRACRVLGGRRGVLQESSCVGVVRLPLLATEESIPGVAAPLGGCEAAGEGVMGWFGSSRVRLSVWLSGCSVLLGLCCLWTTSVGAFCCKLSRSVGRALRGRALAVSLAAWAGPSGAL